MIDKMNDFDYWFYLEPYTFLFHEKEMYVIYNTINSAYIDCSVYDESVHNILFQLFASDGTYSVGLYSKQLANPVVMGFIEKIRETFSGDIIENTQGIAPYIFKPVLRVFHHPENPKTKEYNLLGLNSLLYLHEVSLYLENLSDYPCAGHEDCFKQFLYPAKTGSQNLNIQNYQELLEQLSVCQLDKISIIPGTIKGNGLLSSLMELVDKYNFRTEIILPYRKYDKDELFCFCTKSGISIRMMIHFPVDREELENQISLLSDYTITWVFIITQKEDFDCFEYVSENSKARFECLPWYNGQNRLFFREYVYTEFEDITNHPINRQQIFRRQALNENLFGKLIIYPTGEMYSNVNYPVIGNLLNHKLTEIVYKEICDFSGVWFKTRNYTPCKSCINKYLCPSFSNYEIVMNEYNMCYLNTQI